MGEDRFSPFLGPAAMQGLLGVGVGGESSYIHTFKILLSAQGNTYKAAALLGQANFLKQL